MNAIDDTTGWRYPGGYQWFSAETAIGSTATDKSDLVLSTGLPEGTYDFETYRPPLNLFLIFADTPDTKESIKHFADQYGLLGLTNNRDGAVMLMSEARPGGLKELEVKGGNQSGALGAGELFSAWQRQIQEMRQAVGLWSALREAQSGDATKLSRYVQWPRDDFVYYDNRPDRPIPASARLLGIPRGQHKEPSVENDTEDGFRTIAVLASAALNPAWLRLFRVGDCLMPARYYLQKTVNENLRTRISPQLLWNVRRNRPDNLALFFVPQTLLGLMWLQLAEAINGNRGYRQCAACKGWIVISHEGVGSRSSRFTCSNACRMKIYYGRMVEARRLHQQGLSVKEIAKHLNTAPQKVRGWTEAHAGRPTSSQMRKGWRRQET
jgi:hypothetical protein